MVPQDSKSDLPLVFESTYLSTPIVLRYVIAYLINLFAFQICSMRHSLPSPVVEAASQQASTGIEPPPPSSTKSVSSSRKSKTKETSPLSAKAKRSSSKKKKASSVSADRSLGGGSVLDQIDVRKACLDMLVYTSSSGSDELSKGCANR